MAGRGIGGAERVVVEAGSRLHAGFHSIDPGHGYWGGAGFYVEKPPLRIVSFHCETPSAYGGSPNHRRLVLRVLETLSLRACIEIVEAPPLHHGLGVTTQLTLAAAMAASKLERRDLEAMEAARKLGRGRVSGVGTLLFIHGGFVADAGVPWAGGPKPLLSAKIPESWRFLLLIPEASRGPTEEEERGILRLRKPSGRADHLMARGFIKLAIGIVKGSLEVALEGLKSLQLGTGMFFASQQGGVFRGEIASLVDEAERNGVIMAQSSWGPTLYTITTESEASSDSRLLERICRDAGVPCKIIIAGPRNVGAKMLAY